MAEPTAPTLIPKPQTLSLQVDSEEFYTKEVEKLQRQLANEQHFVTTGERVVDSEEKDEAGDEGEGQTQKGFLALGGGKGERRELPGGAGIAFFSDRVTAAMACQSMHVDDATKWTVQQVRRRDQQDRSRRDDRVSRDA